MITDRLQRIQRQAKRYPHTILFCARGRIVLYWSRTPKTLVACLWGLDAHSKIARRCACPTNPCSTSCAVRPELGNPLKSPATTPDSSPWSVASGLPARTAGPNIRSEMAFRSCSSMRAPNTATYPSRNWANPSPGRRRVESARRFSRGQTRCHPPPDPGRPAGDVQVAEISGPALPAL